ncbi:hypothetical protein Tco_1439077 [Tanacetum coccineum]
MRLDYYSPDGVSKALALTEDGGDVEKEVIYGKVNNDVLAKEVRIYQKSQENRQKRANTDTRTEECTRAGSKVKNSNLIKTKGFSQLKGDSVNPSDLHHDDMVRFVKTSTLISYLKQRSYVAIARSTRMMDFHYWITHETNTRLHNGLPRWQSV